MQLNICLKMRRIANPTPTLDTIKKNVQKGKKLYIGDGTKIVNEMNQYTYPLMADPEEELHNITNGRIASVDVNQAFVLGDKWQQNLGKSYPMAFTNR